MTDVTALSEPVMRTDAYFGSVGFWCSNCGMKLKGRMGSLRHPTHSGLWAKKQSQCPYAGITYVNPFRGMKLERKL